MTKVDDAVLEVFRREQFTAVYIAGPVKAVPRYPGDNRLGRPVKIGHTNALEGDEISRKLDTASAYWPQGVLFRVWVRGKAAARELEDILRARYVGFGFDPLRRQWVEMGAEWDHTFGELDVRETAERLGLEYWSDDELVSYIAGLVRAEMDKVARGGRRGRPAA